MRMVKAHPGHEMKETDRENGINHAAWSVSIVANCREVKCQQIQFVAASKHNSSAQQKDTTKTRKPAPSAMSSNKKAKTMSSNKKAKTNEGNEKATLVNFRCSNDIPDGPQNPKYSVKPERRQHTVHPGDHLFCACCGKEFSNIYQHQGRCENSKYYKVLQDKMRQAYLYLLQRHLDRPTVWQHPGQFKMINADFVVRLKELFPVGVLLSQDKRWNVLMPIKNNKNRVMGYFFQHVMQIVKEEGLKKENELWLCTFSDEKGESNHVCTNWKLHPKMSKQKWTVEEQWFMEEGRLMGQNADNGGRDTCWMPWGAPCTKNPNWFEDCKEELEEIPCGSDDVWRIPEDLMVAMSLRNTTHRDEKQLIPLSLRPTDMFDQESEEEKEEDDDESDEVQV